MKTPFVKRNSISTVLLGFCALIIVLQIPLLIFSSSTEALSISDWKAGNIIDDATFYDNNSMSEAEIQAWLNSKITCDTNGVKTSELGGGADYNGDGRVSRAEWAQSVRGFTGKFVCLNNYYENPNTFENNLRTGVAPAGSISAAAIIKRAADSYKVSPKVLLVKLRKESPGPLTADEWPLPNQFDAAIGYACPDPPLGQPVVCDPAYKGFYRQISVGAWQINNYRINHQSFRYKPFQTNYIQYNPDTSCGGSNVYIENFATAGLYNYTPYQPNAGALANYPGTAYCGAYGNRNFWAFYHEWFNTYDSIFRGLQLSALSHLDSSPALGQTLTYSFTFTNTLPTEVRLSAVGAVGRLGSLTGTNKDLGWVGPVTLQPGASQQFTFSTVVRDTGKIYIWPALLFEGRYVQYNNWSSSLDAHTPNLSLIQQPNITPSSIYAGQNVTFSTVLKSNEEHPISYDAIGIPVRFYDKYSYDATWVGPGVIGAGEEIPLSGIRNIDKPGPYSYWVSILSAGSYSNVGSIQRFNSQDVVPNFSVSTPSLTSQAPVEGGTIGASFTVTNNLPVPISVDAVGVVGRFGSTSGANRDIGWQGPITFAAGETKNFTGYTRSITDVGAHHYWVGILHGGSYMQFTNQVARADSQAPNFSVSTLNFNTTSPTTGSNINASFSVTNNLSVPVAVDAVGVVGRLGSISGANRDIGWQGPITFAAGETKSFTGYSRTITDVGAHHYWVGIFNNNKYTQFPGQGSVITSRAP